MRRTASRPRATLVLESLEDRRLLTTTPVADTLAVIIPQDTPIVTAQSAPTQPQIADGSQLKDSALLTSQDSSSANAYGGTTNTATDPRGDTSTQKSASSLGGDVRQQDGPSRTNSWSGQLLNRGFDFPGRRDQSFNPYWNFDSERPPSPTRGSQKDSPDFSGPLREQETLSSPENAWAPTIKNANQDMIGRPPDGGTLGARSTLLSAAGSIVFSVDDQEMSAPSVNDREPGDTCPLPPIVVLSETRLEERDAYVAPAPALPIDLLAGLINFDAQSLERGVRDFLEQFSDAGKAAQEALEGVNPIPVVVTVGAAALALEMFRHRKRPAAPLFPAATRDESSSWTWVPGMSGVDDV